MRDELLFTVQGSTATPAQQLTLAEAGFTERQHLQEWVIGHPEILGPDILIVTMEFDRWKSASASDASRLDILGLHSSGELVVAELKRDTAPDTVEMQAVKYAAMASRFTPETLADQHARFLAQRGQAVELDAAAELLAKHADTTPESLRRPRVVLLASDYPPTTAATAVWLSEMGIDITLMQYHAYRTGEEISVSVSQLYPVPTVEDFTISPRQAEVRAAEDKGRRRQDVGTVAKIVSTGLLEDGTPLVLRPYGINAALREQLDAWLDEDPRRRRARWTNEEAHPITWEANGESYTPTTLARSILREATGVERSMRGGEWWTDPDGTDLVTLARNAGNWDEGAFRHAVERYVPPLQGERLLALVDRLLKNPHNSGVNWGGGQYPSANLSFSFPGSANDYGAVIMSVFTRPEKIVLAINFEWMRRSGIEAKDMEQVADALQILPGAPAVYAGRERAATTADLRFRSQSSSRRSAPSR